VRSADIATHARVREHMRGFFASSKATPCAFANASASAGKRGKESFAWSTLRGECDGGTADLVTRLLEGAASVEQTVAIVFPDFHDGDDVLALLARLAESPRWAISVPSVTKWRGDAVLVAVHWTTTGGLRSSIMGVGPLGSMPEQRRAPYFALVGWGGPHRNPHHPARKTAVSLVSSSLLPAFATKAKHDKAWKLSEKRTTAMRGLPFGESAHHQVAFSLPPRHRDRIAELARVSSQRTASS
jgi:hypothetical protein